MSIKLAVWGDEKAWHHQTKPNQTTHPLCTRSRVLLCHPARWLHSPGGAAAVLHPARPYPAPSTPAGGFFFTPRVVKSPSPSRFAVPSQLSAFVPPPFRAALRSSDAINGHNKGLWKKRRICRRGKRGTFPGVLPEAVPGERWHMAAPRGTATLPAVCQLSGELGSFGGWTKPSCQQSWSYGCCCQGCSLSACGGS